MATGLLGSLLLPSLPVLAETETSTPTDAATNLAKRLEERKAAVKIKLQSAEQVRLQAHCKAAQVRIKVLDNQLKASSTRQTARLADVTNRLKNLQTKLTDQNVDTSQLAASLATLNSKIATYNADFQIYSQAIKDLGDMDCVADPTGFKTTLEAARAKQATIKNDFKDVTNYIQQTIKPILVQIKTSLASKEAQ